MVQVKVRLEEDHLTACRKGYRGPRAELSRSLSLVLPPFHRSSSLWPKYLFFLIKKNEFILFFLMAESKEELKSFLMKVRKESERAGLKLNAQ